VAAIAIAAAEHGAAAGQNDATAPSIRITSPLGRTGLAGKVRIVAHVQPAGGILSPVSFLVDGALIGTTEAGPSCAVDWTDENPFEPREIVVQAMDAKRHMIRDVVVLPPFQITDTTDVNSVLLETGVYDQTGRFVADVDPASFVVRENDVRQKIDLVTREALPTTLLLLVDNSQSMSRRMDFVRQAAERLGRALRRRDKVIVAPFNAHVGTVTGPTDDAATLAGAIAAMQSGGGTAILDGLLEGTRLLRGIEGRRAIILITDGYDENSTSAVADVLKRAEDSQVTIYVVGIGGVAGPDHGIGRAGHRRSQPVSPHLHPVRPDERRLLARHQRGSAGGIPRANARRILRTVTAAHPAGHRIHRDERLARLRRRGGRGPRGA
jgi:hypothetical protein